MLRALQIENIAVIESASIAFGNGLNVMTGETGAGKSIIIDSIHAVLGQRTSKELIRSGCDSASVTAEFEAPGQAVVEKLAELGLETDEDILILQRKISAQGKSSCRVNGTPVTASMLKEIGARLLNIHGQHDNQSLLNREYHITYLDNLIADPEIRERYRKSYKALCAVIKKLNAMDTDEAEKARRLDFLRFEIEELEHAGIEPGEKAQLMQRKEICRHAEQVLSALQDAELAISGLDETAGALQLVQQACTRLQQAAEHMQEAETAANGLYDISGALQGYQEELRALAAGFTYDPAELAEIDDRLDALYHLSKKYGATEEEMLRYLAGAKQERDEIVFADEMLAKLEAEFETKKEETYLIARKLSQLRMEAGEQFAGKVMEELQYLDMPGAVFAVQREETAVCGAGIDKIEFLLSTNPGEPPKPLAKIASGGELSRIMLAIKNVLAGTDAIETLIFDEIDAGISGRAAQKVGAKLKAVSKGKQVLCITHLAQIAAQADSHLLIEKSVRNGKTYTNVTALDFESRKAELARIMGGMNTTGLMLEPAEAMLKENGIQ